MLEGKELLVCRGTSSTIDSRARSAPGLPLIVIVRTVEDRGSNPSSIGEFNESADRVYDVSSNNHPGPKKILEFRKRGQPLLNPASQASLQRGARIISPLVDYGVDQYRVRKNRG